MKLGTQIQFRNGNRGVLLTVHGSVHTFGKIDKNGQEIRERSRLQAIKHKVFIIDKGSLNQLIKVGDVELYNSIRTH